MFRLHSRLVDGLEGLKSLKPAWEKLESGAWLPMQQLIWAQASAEVFARQSVLRVVVVEKGGEVAAIAPLIRAQGQPSFQLLGVPELQEPMDVLYSSPEALSALAAAIVEMGIPLLLKRVPAGSAFPAALKEAFHRRGFFAARPEGAWPRVSLDSSWLEPESHLNQGRRSDLRRAGRIAGEMGKVTTEILSPVPAALAPLLEEALAVEAAGWKGASGTALAMDRERGEFYRRYADAACQKGILRLGFLRIGGRAAAMQFAVETGGGYWLLKIGYDSEFSRASPGNLLLCESLRQAAGRGVKSFAFLGAVEPWKKQWTQEEEACLVLRGYPWGVRGGTALALDLAKSACEKLLRFGRMAK